VFVNEFAAATWIVMLTGISTFGQTIQVSWGKIEGIFRTTPTLQVVVNPPLRPGSAIHENAW
jgi:hypothetical protein